MTHVYCCDQGVPDVSEIGGKAANLGILTALHQTVPKWFAVKASAFLSTMTESGLDRKVNVLTDTGQVSHGMGQFRRKVFGVRCNKT